jgi:hypothetical protein
MALAQTPLPQICKSISQYLAANMDTGDETVPVLIGTPADAVPATNDGHRLNLFFFRFEVSGITPDSLPGETVYLRSHCLVTPFAIEEMNVATAGENDLRLLGEVLRVFHENPVFELSVEDDEGAALGDFHVQVIFQNLGLEQINQLWSTQGEVTYRPSLAYELALIPVIPDTPDLGGPLTSGLDIQVQNDMSATAASGDSREFIAIAETVDTTAPGWQPLIYFLQDGQCKQSLNLLLSELAGFTPVVLVAGEIGSTVQLYWDQWDGTNGWRTLEPAVDVTLSQSGIDPDNLPETAPPLLNLTLPSVTEQGQLVLYAQRTYPRAGDNVPVTVRSNILVINITGSA